MKQTMEIPSHPDVDTHDYSIIGLGLSWFDISEQSPNRCWKLVTVLESRRVGFGEEGYVKIRTFDPVPVKGSWTTRPALFSDEFDQYLSHVSKYNLYLDSPPVYLDGALYWAHTWKNQEGLQNRRVYTRIPYRRRYRCRNVESGDPLYLVKLCLKTNIFQLIQMPLTDPRNSGLLSESEGRLRYSHFCAKEGLRIWVFNNMDTSTAQWRQTHCIATDVIDFFRNPSNKEVLQVLPSEDENDEKEYLSVHGFNEELHTIIFKVGCGSYMICYDFEEKKTVSLYHYSDILPTNLIPISMLETDPITPPREVVSLWVQEKKAVYKYKYWLQAEENKVRHK